jgi:periplasmic protein TonB
MRRNHQGLGLRALVALAFCATALAVQAGPSDATVVSKADLDFPREAVQANVDKGKVKAKLTIDAGGEVTRVDIINAEPRRVFDKAVTRSLSQWRFNAGDANRSYEIELEFKR